MNLLVSLYRIMLVRWLVDWSVTMLRQPFQTYKIGMKMQLIILILLIMMILMIIMMVQESVKMCLNVLKNYVSSLHYKIIRIYTTIDTSLNRLTGLLYFIISWIKTTWVPFYQTNDRGEDNWIASLSQFFIFKYILS